MFALLSTLTACRPICRRAMSSYKLPMAWLRSAAMQLPLIRPPSTPLLSTNIVDRVPSTREEKVSKAKGIASNSCIPIWSSLRARKQTHTHSGTIILVHNHLPSINITAAIHLDAPAASVQIIACFLFLYLNRRKDRWRSQFQVGDPPPASSNEPTRHFSTWQWTGCLCIQWLNESSAYFVCCN